MQSQPSGMMDSELFNDRSTLVLPGQDGTSQVIEGMRLRERSTAEYNLHRAPANARALGESRPNKSTDVVPHYDEISLLQYYSSYNLKKHIKVTLPISIPTWPIVGRGRIFTVRRFPTGWGDDQSENNYFAPAAAVKCLASSVRGGEEERSLRYRCLMQELRILLHEPIKNHPNFSRISELGWEPDPLAPNCFLPCLYEEYAVFGSLDNLMGAVDLDYIWKQRLMLDVAEGLRALHKCGIAHSDVKMENVMVFRCEDAFFDVIAKLSDFGFSVEFDVSQPETKLIGCTPLWAAPEVLEGLQYLDLAAADIYSLGFVIWSIAIDGGNPTKALDNMIGSEDIIRDWVIWKQTNELASLAAAQLNSMEDPRTLDVEEVCHLLSLVLQADPTERDMHAVLHNLRGRCKRASQNEDFECLEYSNLPPFDHNVIDIKESVWRQDWLRPRLRNQVLARLETIASSDMQSKHEIASEEHWRQLPVPAHRATAAAFALGVAHLQGFEESSLNTACLWFHTAGKQGHALSQAFLAKFMANYHSGVLGGEEEASSWLQAAASHGSKSALCQLKQHDGHLGAACLNKFRKYFWVRAYDVAESWISTILSPTLDWLPSEPDAIALGRYGTSLLQCAAMMGASSVVHAILDMTKDPDAKSVLINKKNSRGDTALLLACKAGHASLVQYLLQAGADASLCNNNGENSLHWLTSLDDDCTFDIAWALISGGARVGQSARDDFELISRTASRYFHRLASGTPLHRAAASANTVVIRTLLSLGADPVVESWRFTPLCLAAMARSSQAVDILLAEIAPSYNVNKLYPTLGGKREVTTLTRAIPIDKTLTQYINPGLGNNNDFPNIVSSLLSAGARSIGPPHNAVTLCVWHGEIAALEIILRQDGNSLKQIVSPGDNFESNALLTAISMEDERALDILINAGASTVSGVRFGQTGLLSPLQLCAKSLNQKTKCMERLLAISTDVDVCYDTHSSDTALYYALQTDQIDTARFLIARGASLTKQSEDGDKRNVLAEILLTSPGPILLRAVELLSNSQIDIPLLINGLHRRTIFHCLCMQSPISKLNMRRADWQAVFEIFVHRFSDPMVLNSQDRYGYTALHLAAYHAIPIAVELLLKAGAKPDIGNNNGMTPIQAVKVGDFRPVPAMAFFSRKHMDIYLGHMRETQQLLLNSEEAESAWCLLQARQTILTSDLMKGCKRPKAG